jgi:hypothetical protein
MEGKSFITLGSEGPDEETLKQERLKQMSQELQMGWHDNKKVS